MDRVDQMYEAVKQKILDLEVDPTQPIDEKVLVRETGGSLTLVRQALDRLAEEGIVAKRRGRWYITRAATTSIMLEIFEVRTTLEGMCARLAAERITDEQIAAIEQVHHDFDRVIHDHEVSAFGGDRSPKASSTKSKFFVTNPVDSCIVKIDRPTNVALHTSFELYPWKYFFKSRSINNLFDNSTLWDSSSNVV